MKSVLRCPACGRTGMDRIDGSLVCRSYGALTRRSRSTSRCDAVYPDGFVEQFWLMVADAKYAARRKKGEAGELVLK